MLKPLLLGVAALALLASPRAAAAEPDAGRSAHHELGVHFGLLQPLLLHGFNAAVEYRRDRFIATYSHGIHLDPGRVSGTLTDAEDAAGMSLALPYSTGGGVGARVWRGLYALADVKLHHYVANAGAEDASYSTVTVGGEVGYRFELPYGFTITPVVRYWPNVWDNAPDGGVLVPTATGETLMHAPIAQGVGGLFANVLVGWKFDLTPSSGR
jgi:hypothetical protein